MRFSCFPFSNPLSPLTLQDLAGMPSSPWSLPYHLSPRNRPLLSLSGLLCLSCSIQDLRGQGCCLLVLWSCYLMSAHAQQRAGVEKACGLKDWMVNRLFFVSGFLPCGLLPRAGLPAGRQCRSYAVERAWNLKSEGFGACLSRDWLWVNLAIQSTHRLAAAAAKLLQSCLTLCNPIDGSPPGSQVPGIL